jgi:hypothetical protein
MTDPTDVPVLSNKAVSESLRSLYDRVPEKTIKFFNDKFQFTKRVIAENQTVLLEIQDLQNGYQYILGTLMVVGIAIFQDMVIRTVISISGVLVYLYMRRRIKRESILVDRQRGIQIYRQNFSGDIVDLKFYEWPNIDSVMINEALTTFRVVTYIVIVISSGCAAGESTMVPFKNFRIPLSVNVEIATNLRESMPSSIKAAKADS